jgi:DNA ligase 1
VQLSLGIDVYASSSTSSASAAAANAPALSQEGGKKKKSSASSVSAPAGDWEAMAASAAAAVGVGKTGGGSGGGARDGESADEDVDDGQSRGGRGGGGEEESSDSKATAIYKDFDEGVEEGWKAGEAVPFAFLAATLDAVQATSKRLEIAAIMTNALRRVLVTSPGDLVAVVHITLGRIAPPHEGLELGVGDSVLIQAMAKTMGVEEKRIKEEYKKTGDLGLVAAGAKGKQTTLAPPKPLTVTGVFATLEACAKLSGKDSVKARRDLICALLMSARNNEALWIIRVLQGKLRVGLAEPTVITSLATALILNPPAATGQTPPTEEERKDKCAEAAEELKMALARLPCYKTVIPILMEQPMANLSTRCPLTPGVPVKPMLAHPAKGINEVMKGCFLLSRMCSLRR